jgi:hypothetical protein
LSQQIAFFRFDLGGKTASMRTLFSENFLAYLLGAQRVYTGAAYKIYSSWPGLSRPGRN